MSKYILNNLNSYTSLISILFSTISLVISFINLRYLFPKMKFKVQKNSFYCSSKDFKVTGFHDDYFALISLKISNLSKLPNTIDEAYLNKYILNGGHCNDIRYKVLNIENKKYINHIETPDEIVNSSIEPYEPVKLPLRIEPFDTVLCSFNMPFSHNKKFKSHILSINTPRKVYTVPLVLKEYHDLFPQYKDSNNE